MPKNIQPSMRLSLENIVKTVGEEFVPKLSERTTTQKYIDYLLAQDTAYLIEKFGQDAYVEYPIVLTHPHDGDTQAFVAGFAYHSTYKCAYIACVMAIDSARDTKISSRLISKFLAQLKGLGATRVVVTTWSTNKSSQRLFKNAGFNLFKAVKNERAEEVHGLYYRIDI